jgi:hypothetical protein
MTVKTITEIKRLMKNDYCKFGMLTTDKHKVCANCGHCRSLHAQNSKREWYCMHVETGGCACSKWKPVHKHSLTDAQIMELIKMKQLSEGSQPQLTREEMMHSLELGNLIKDSKKKVKKK